MIKEEHAKIQAYEAAFQQIKEATGVSDVNEVIKRFLLQEETHQNLMNMTKDSQAKIATMREDVDVAKAAVMNAEYSVANGDADAAGAQETDATQQASAAKQLARQRERYTKDMKILVATKSAVQHIVDVLEPLREKDEVVAPMSDDTLLQHLQFAESKLNVISQSFFEMEDEHKELLTAISQPHMKRPTISGDKKDPFSVGTFERKDEGNESDEEFEEDREEDVMDRNALKKQSTSIVDKGAKKKGAKKKRRAKEE